MKRLTLLIIALSFLSCTYSKKPAITVSSQETFRSEDLLEMTYTASNAEGVSEIILSRRPRSEEETNASRCHLKHMRPDGRVISAETFKLHFRSIMKAVTNDHGADLDITGFSSFEFSRVRETEIESALTFRDYIIWQRYLEKRSLLPQWEIYDRVLKRWQEQVTFAVVGEAFAEFGRRAELSSFEKLFIFRVSESPVREELKELGFTDDMSLPCPGSVHFTIHLLTNT